MKNENIFILAISVLSLIVSIFSLLFFYLYPYIKQHMINKTFTRIEKFYSLYSYLNPWLLPKGTKTQNLTYQLIHQSLFSSGLPKFNYLFENIGQNIFEFNPFVLRYTSWEKQLTITEIIYFYNFWKKALPKLNYIKNVINKYDYIMEVELKRKIIVYRDSSEKKIEESSISLCPSFDKMKLLRIFTNPSSFDHKETKFNLDCIDELEYNEKNKYKKELKSNKFSLNLRFSGSDANNEYCYSIIFENEKITRIETFLDSNILYYSKKPSKETIEKTIKDLEWINKTFNINSISLINDPTTTKYIKTKHYL
ncbi:hypothetical protein N8G13_02995 [Mycoplasma zalophi]|uniref:hypothetical protein n=1 Tax=Mycoplasma zalophi TaxID=191287 RepID=UPI0021C8E010|nr:hypothetical protein [Mycoplasma zalophi]MCU4117409.1 hypothetical protein [Mycoplasma zalophi]